ncbi:Zinc finger C2H2 [Penicillium malachiteum]|nr:Zinc finger C2H2 [Penicillium malachiteum]
MEWIGYAKHGWIEERPIVETILGFFREFATGLKRERSIELPLSTRTIINKFVLGELKLKIALLTNYGVATTISTMVALLIELESS